MASPDRTPEPLVLFWSAFNHFGFGAARRTPEWTDARFRHWLAFTLPSILGQDHAEFDYWLICDPATRHLTEPLRDAIVDPRVALVYADEAPAFLRQLPKRSRYLVTRVDSDDLYHPRAARNLVGRTPSREFFQFNDGFACDVRSGEVRTWRSRSSPFYSHVYGEELRRIEAWDEPNHTTVAPRATVLGRGHFLVTFHGENTSSSIELGRTGLTGDEARRALRSFGLGRDRTLRSLLASCPAPASWYGRWRAIRDLLRPSHTAYRGGVSSPSAAVSLETATLFYFLCEVLAVRSVLDLGAGYGSVVSRLFALNRPGTVCHTVDTSDERLNWTADFLTARGISGGGLLRFDDARQELRQRYDLVLHDLGDMRSRVDTLAEACAAARPTGLVLLDDYHRPELEDAVVRYRRRVCADSYPEVAEMTRDQSGGCSMLLGRVIAPLEAPRSSSEPVA